MTAEAAALADRFLDAVDEVQPGLVVGAYLVGSAVHGDYKPGKSDVDIVTLVDGELEAPVIDRLRELQPRFPRLDGIHVTAEQLATGDVPEVFFHHGRLWPHDPYGATPVTRRELVSLGRHLRGPAIDELDVRDDPVELVTWVRDNLHSYWADWVRKAAGWSLLSLYALVPRAIEYCVLGPARMACTLATGAVVSKTAGGEWAREHLDHRYESILTQALRIRGGRFATPINTERKAEALAFMAHVVQTH